MLHYKYCSKCCFKECSNAIKRNFKNGHKNSTSKKGAMKTPKNRYSELFILFFSTVLFSEKRSQETNERGACRHDGWTFRCETGKKQPGRILQSESVSGSPACSAFALHSLPCALPDPWGEPWTKGQFDLFTSFGSSLFCLSLSVSNCLNTCRLILASDSQT